MYSGAGDRLRGVTDVEEQGLDADLGLAYSGWHKSDMQLQSNVKFCLCKEQGLLLTLQVSRPNCRCLD